MELLYFDQQEPLPQRPVVTIGMFDGVHRGHQVIINKLLESSKKNQIPALLLTFNQHPRFFFNQDNDSLKLLTTLEERYMLLNRMGISQCIEIPFNKETSSLSTLQFINHYLIHQLHFSGIIIGYDHHFGNKQANDFNEIYQLSEEKGFFIQKTYPLYCDEIPISSTQIRNSILSNDIILANKMLGYPYFFSGLVIEGEKKGRTIGFPTANISHVNSHKLLPPDGVYAVNILFKNTSYKGMMNMGINPTFPNHKHTIEVHLFSFEGNLYGKQITIEVLKKIREERRFDSIIQLKDQLEKDKEKCLHEN